MGLAGAGVNDHVKTWQTSRKAGSTQDHRPPVIIGRGALTTPTALTCEMSRRGWWEDEEGQGANCWYRDPCSNSFDVHRGVVLAR